MKAVVFRGTEQTLACAERPLPELDDGEVLLKVAYCGICGSDLHAARDPAFRLPVGQILGHEFSGEIVATRATDWRVGDLVCAAPLHECTACRGYGGCRRNLGMLCPDNKVIGLAEGAEGAYAEYVKVGGSHAFRLPEGISLAQGALVEPLAVGSHAVNAGAVQGKSVLVIGAGPIGLTVIAFARISGAAHVIASEPNAERRALAGAMGASGVIDPTGNDVGAAFRAIAGGPPEVIFDCAGISGMLRQMIRLAAIRARIVIVGASAAPETFIPMLALFRELEVKFVLGYERADFHLALDVMRDGRLDTAALLSRIISLNEVPEMFAALQKPNAYAKILIKPH